MLCVLCAVFFRSFKVGRLCVLIIWSNIVLFLVFHTFQSVMFVFDFSLLYYYFTRESGGKVLWWARLCVCLSVHLSVRKRHMRHLYRFLVHVAYGRSSVLLQWGDEIPRGRGNFGVFCPLTMHCNVLAAKGIIWSPIMSCSSRDHAIAAAFAANGIGWEGRDGSAQHGQSVICDCLVLLLLLEYGHFKLSFVTAS